MKTRTSVTDPYCEKAWIEQQFFKSQNQIHFWKCFGSQKSNAQINWLREEFHPWYSNSNFYNAQRISNEQKISIHKTGVKGTPDET